MLEADFQFATDSRCEGDLSDAVRVTLQHEAFRQHRTGRTESVRMCVHVSVQSHLHAAFKNHNSI